MRSFDELARLAAEHEAERDRLSDRLGLYVSLGMLAMLAALVYESVLR